MKIEDDLRSTLRERVERVRADDEAAWTRFEERGRRRDTSGRVAAAVVAVVVAVAALVLVIRGFAPNNVTQPATSPTYTSVEQIVQRLRDDGAGCSHRGAVPSTAVGVKDVGTCRVGGAQITINLYATPAAMRRYARPPKTPGEWAGLFWVRGTNWFIGTSSAEAATTVRSILGGRILGGTGAAPSVTTPTPIPTCAPNGEPWASDACPESVWLRKVVAVAGGTIEGVTDGIEPQRGDAFVVSFDGYRFSLGAISRADMTKMGAYFSMGEFSAGMAQAGSVGGVELFGNRRMGHWLWDMNGFTVQVFPFRSSSVTDHLPRQVVAHLVIASDSAR